MIVGLLYVNKRNNSQQRQNAPGVKFPDRIMSADYSNSLSRYRSIVNGTFKNIYDRKSVDDSIEKEPYSYLSDDRIMQAQPWIKDVKALEKLAKEFSRLMDVQRESVAEHGAENTVGEVRYSKKGQSQGIFSNKTVDDYTRIQYNSYGWVAVNNIMTVNELNRFYKQFANTKMLDYNYQKSFDGYYMIPTGDISMVDTKIVFVSVTVQDPYIDRVLTLNNLSDDESNFYVNEVIDCGGQFDSFSYLENLTGKRIFKEYTCAGFEDYVSRKNRREKLASTSFTNTDANRRRSYGSQKRDGFANKKSVDDESNLAIKKGNPQLINAKNPNETSVNETAVFPDNMIPLTSKKAIIQTGKNP